LTDKIIKELVCINLLNKTLEYVLLHSVDILMTDLSTT
jgi:hypothetical protein